MARAGGSCLAVSGGACGPSLSPPSDRLRPGEWGSHPRGRTCQANDGARSRGPTMRYPPSGAVLGDETQTRPAPSDLSVGVDGTRNLSSFLPRGLDSRASLARRAPAPAPDGIMWQPHALRNGARANEVVPCALRRTAGPMAGPAGAGSSNSTLPHHVSRSKEHFCGGPGRGDEGRQGAEDIGVLRVSSGCQAEMGRAGRRWSKSGSVGLRPYWDLQINGCHMALGKLPT